MKRYFALMIVFVIAILSYFDFKCLSSVLNDNEFEISAFDISRNEVMYLDACMCDDLIKNLNVEVHSKNEIAGRIIIEGYSQKLSDYVIINKLKTNIQMSICGDHMIVGYPLIKGSF